MCTGGCIANKGGHLKREHKVRTGRALVEAVVLRDAPAGGGGHQGIGVVGAAHRVPARPLGVGLPVLTEAELDALLAVVSLEEIHQPIVVHLNMAACGRGWT